MQSWQVRGTNIYRHDAHLVLLSQEYLIIAMIHSYMHLVAPLSVSFLCSSPTSRMIVAIAEGRLHDHAWCISKASLHE